MDSPHCVLFTIHRRKLQTKKWHHFTDILMKLEKRRGKVRYGMENDFFFSTHFDNDYGKNAWMEMKKEDMKMLSTRINFNGQYNFFLASCMLSIVTFKVTRKKAFKI